MYLSLLRMSALGRTDPSRDSRGTMPTQDLRGDCCIVKGNPPPVGKLLTLLVPLAGYDHDVAGASNTDRPCYRFAAIHLVLDSRATAGEDLVDDRLGRL